MKKNILICGAGSVGIYLGLKLYGAGNHVHLFGGRKLKSIKDGSISVNGKKYKIPPILSALPVSGDYDFIFVATKLYDTDDILKQIKNNNVCSKVIVSIQNGLVDNSAFNFILGTQKLHVMAIFEGFNVRGRELVMTPTDMGWRTEYCNEGREISSMLSEAGINCVADPTLERVRAEKSIINCCLNALSAIENKTFEQLFLDRKILERINRLFNECYLILSGEFNLDKASEIYSRMILTWKNMKHYSSTWQDIHDKDRNKTEIDFLNGYLVKLAIKQGLPFTENNKVIIDLEAIN